MNVLIFTKSTSIVGGVEKVVDIHCEWLLNLKAKVKIFTLRKTSYEVYKTNHYENIAKNEIKYFESILGKNLGVSLIKELLNEFRSISKIIVHLPFLNGLLGIIISTLINKIRNKRIPDIYIYHHAIPSKNYLSRFVYIFLSKVLFTINKKTTLIASSNSIENINFSKYLHTSLNIIAIPIPKINGSLINEDEKKIFTNLKETFLKPSKNIYDFVYIGRIAEYKGLINLVRAVPLIKNNIRIIIAGVGPMSQKIKRIINSFPSKWRSKVVFVNRYIEEVEKYQLLKLSDVFIFPSITKSEAYGIMQLEALFMGLPIINTFLGTGVNIIAKESDYVVTFKEKNSCKALAKSINEMEFRLSSDKYSFTREFIIDETKKHFSDEIVFEQFKKVIGIN